MPIGQPVAGLYKKIWQGVPESTINMAHLSVCSVHAWGTQLAKGYSHVVSRSWTLLGNVFVSVCSKSCSVIRDGMRTSLAGEACYAIRQVLTSGFGGEGV